ncbi:MAG: 3D domain-containing protein [Gemmatimonadaceae bacterium]|nr:3D domain-containing protein [Gemmatimonadaceae bacterium]
MRFQTLIRTAVASVTAAALIKADVVHMPYMSHVLEHTPIVVYGEPSLPPTLVQARRSFYLKPELAGPFDRAAPGRAVPVSLTQYCLQGTTRRGRYVRPGIVAADPRVFPLARYVEVFLGKEYLGRFLVDDTGKNVLGPTLDIWTEDCGQARRFGRKWGHAVLVARGQQ